MKSSNVRIQLFWIVSLYTRLDKSYITFLPNLKSSNWSFVVLQSLMYLTVENTVQDYEKMYIYLQFTKVIGNAACSFFLKPTVLHSSLKANHFSSMFILVHFSDREECNVYRSRGNTTAACKHVTVFFFPRFSIEIILFIFLITLNPHEPQHVLIRALALMSA